MEAVLHLAQGAKASTEIVGVRARDVRLSEKPALSVLITSRGSRERLAACLDVLLAQSIELGAEVLVVRVADRDEIDELSQTYPAARFTFASADASLSELRRVGMSQVSGDIVMLQPDDVPAEDWLPPRLAKHRAQP